MFQSTPPRRRRQNPPVACGQIERFNPRLREGGDVQKTNVLDSLGRFQSTPPRRRRHFKATFAWFIKTVSIHASAKEATRSARPRDGHHGGFNPRLREGGDAGLANNATDKIQFQSTPPRRRRLDLAIISTGQQWQFQSTPPRRRRPSSKVKARKNFSFQSTPPRRRRHARMRKMQSVIKVSIHASAKEATHKSGFLWRNSLVFQSTPPRRRRLIFYSTVISGRCFNPRLREGGDLFIHGGKSVKTLFQSTPPRRRRPRT